MTNKAVKPAVPYIVGERGPEWYVPKANGYVYPVRRRRLAWLRRLLRLRP